MSTILRITNVKKTRKLRRCDWCGELVRKGDQSVVMAAIWDGEFHSTRFHPECYHGWNETELIEYFEWSPYEQDRGYPIKY